MTTKKLEIIVFPLEEFEAKPSSSKELKLTTFKCYGKKKDFSRDDAYKIPTLATFDHKDFKKFEEITLFTLDGESLEE